jgi:hypothetical protein
MEEYNWAQGRINDLTKTQAEDRHAKQRLNYTESRAERRARERAEKNDADRAKKVRS